MIDVTSNTQDKNSLRANDIYQQRTSIRLFYETTAKSELVKSLEHILRDLTRGTT